MKNSKLVSLLSICRKAGKLTTGFDAVVESMQDAKARLVLLACDLSDKTRSELHFSAGKCQYAGDILQTQQTMDELSVVLSKRTGVLAITDAGLAQAILSELSKQGGADRL